jgi:hypothetical protein
VKLATGLAGLGAFACSPRENETQNKTSSSKAKARTNRRMPQPTAEQHVSFTGII